MEATGDLFQRGSLLHWVWAPTQQDAHWESMLGKPCAKSIVQLLWPYLWRESCGFYRKDNADRDHDSTSTTGAGLSALGGEVKVRPCKRLLWQSWPPLCWKSWKWHFTLLQGSFRPGERPLTSQGQPSGSVCLDSSVTNQVIAFGSQILFCTCLWTLWGRGTEFAGIERSS